MLMQAHSSPDPHVLIDIDGKGHIYREPVGKTVADPRLVSGESTLVIVTAGQSNIANSVDTPYTPTNATKVDQLCVDTGGTYRAVDPLLGTTGTIGNLSTRIADALVTGGVCARVIIIPVAIGATAVAEWETNKALYQRLIVAGRRAAAVGLTVNAFLWMQGESDTVAGTSQAAYQASLANVIAIPRNEGFTAPWFVAQCSLISGGTSSAIRAAQAAVVNGTTIFAGPDTDTLTGATNRQVASDPHFTAVGAAAAAALWKTAIDVVL